MPEEMKIVVLIWVLIVLAPVIWFSGKKIADRFGNRLRGLKAGDMVLFKSGGQHYELRVQKVTKSREHFYAEILGSGSWLDTDQIEDRIETQG